MRVSVASNKILLAIALLMVINTAQCHCVESDLSKKCNELCFNDKLDTTVYLPLYIISDTALADSIESAISQLENNINFYEEYGYVFVLNFVTLENTDSIKVSISVHSIQLIYPLTTFRPFEYVKTIGCMKVKGYLVLVDVCSFVSQEEINFHIKRTNKSIKFEVSEKKKKKLFGPRPFNKMEFYIPFQNKSNYVPPNKWNHYKTNFKD